LQQTPVTAGLQGLPKKAPCKPLPEQVFDVPAITENAAASQKVKKEKRRKIIYFLILHLRSQKRERF